jgi:hypothetical protein
VARPPHRAGGRLNRLHRPMKEPAMKRIALISLYVVVAAVGVIATVGFTDAPAASSPTSTKPRIGVYDSRAVAIAWAASKYFQDELKQKKAECDKARADGDNERVKQLEAWGEMQQRKLHFQGFGQYPVDDLLAPVAEKLPEVVKNAGVCVIVARCDYQSPDSQIVDVTDAIVQLYDPSARTLRSVQGIRKAKPIPFETLFNMSPND